MVADFRSQREPGDLVAWASKWDPSPAECRYLVGHDKPDPLQTGLVPKLDGEGSAEEQYPFNAAASYDPRSPRPSEAGNHHGLQSASSDHAPKQEDSTRSKVFAGPFGFSEEALVRLEAGLHAQREQILARAPHVTAAPGICPSDPPVQDQLPRPDDSEDHLPPVTSDFQPGLQSASVGLQSPTSDKRPRRWQLQVIILIPVVVAALALPAPEQAAVNYEVVGPAQILPALPNLPTAAQEVLPVDNQTSQPLPGDRSGLQAPTPSAPGALTVTSIQPLVQPPTNNRGAISSQSKPPSRVSHRGRKILPVASPVR